MDKAYVELAIKNSILGQIHAFHENPFLMDSEIDFQFDLANRINDNLDSDYRTLTYQEDESQIKPKALLNLLGDILTCKRVQFEKKMYYPDDDSNNGYSMVKPDIVIYGNPNSLEWLIAEREKFGDDEYFPVDYTIELKVFQDPGDGDDDLEKLRKLYDYGYIKSGFVLEYFLKTCPRKLINGICEDIAHIPNWEPIRFTKIAVHRSYEYLGDIVHYQTYLPIAE